MKKMKLLFFLYTLCLLFSTLMLKNAEANNIFKVKLGRKSTPSPPITSLPETKTVILNDVNKALNEKAAVKKQTSKARRALLSCTTIYGTTYVTTKLLQNSLSAEFINFVRFSIAAIFFLPSILPNLADIGLLLTGIELGVWCGLGFMAQALGLQIADASKVSLIGSLGVIVTPMLDLILSLWNRLLRRTSKDISTKVQYAWWRAFISPLIALTGAMILEYGGMHPPNPSDAVLLLIPFSFAMCFWRSEHHAAVKYPNQTKAITGIMLLTTAILSALWMVAIGSFPMHLEEWLRIKDMLLFDKQILPMLFYNGLLATAWTAITEQHALKVLSASDTSLVYSLEPVFASIFAALYLKEHLGWNVIFGSICVIIACLIH